MITQEEYYQFGFCRGHQLGKCHAYKLKHFPPSIAVAKLIVEHDDFYAPKLTNQGTADKYREGCKDGFLAALGYQWGKR